MLYLQERCTPSFLYFLNSTSCPRDDPYQNVAQNPISSKGIPKTSVCHLAINSNKTAPGSENLLKLTTTLELHVSAVFLFRMLIFVVVSVVGFMGLSGKVEVVITKAILQVEGAKQNEVTCGSVLKLVNVNYDAKLHSHEVRYGGGSGQQSVTGISDGTESNSYWQVSHRSYWRSVVF